MNLYEINFEHYAPKGSESGIAYYLVASDCESVYNWISEISENEISYKDKHTHGSIVSGWYDKTDEGVDEFDYEDLKKQVISHCGEIGTDYANFDDLYYGKTFYGWKMISENVEESVVALLTKLGVPTFLYKPEQ